MFEGEGVRLLILVFDLHSRADPFQVAPQSATDVFCFQD